MTPRTLLPALFAWTLTATVAESCGEDGPGSGGGPGLDAGGGGEPDALEDRHDAVSEDSADAEEEPWGEAGWTPVAWDAPCPVEVAEHPKAAAPPLAWDPCPDGSSGCQQARLDWDHRVGLPWGLPSVIPWGAGYRVGALLFYKNQERRSVVYDEAGKPVIAWRANECALVVPILTPNRVWMGAQSETQASWIVEPYEELAKTALVANVKAEYQGYAANDIALGLWGPSGNTMVMFDRLSGMAKTFGPSPGLGFYQPYPVNESALMRQFPEFGRAEGWIWNRQSNAALPLLQPGNSISVLDVKSDGSTLAWVEAKLPFDMNGLYQSADLWTSTFATDKSGIVATKRRALPALGEVLSHVSDGFYALYAFGDKMVHVYRLSDARHWAFKPPVSSSDFYDVSYVDKDYVWYQTITSIYRQSIAALGPGDLPP